MLINLRDLDFIEQAISNNKIYFRDSKDLENFISIFCDLVSRTSILSRKNRLIASKIVVNTKFGLRINPSVVNAVNKKIKEVQEK